MNGPAKHNPDTQTVVVKWKQNGEYIWMPLALCDLVVMPDEELKLADDENRDPDWSLGTLVKDTARLQGPGTSGGMIP